MKQTTTEVAVVGAGPAGLMLSHLLGRAGIDSIAIDVRSRHEIEETHRAGILERDSVRLLVDSGVSDRVLREGDEHQGIELAFGGARHRIDFRDAVGASVWLYPQTDVFRDLADARQRVSADVRFGVSGVSVADLTSERPAMRFTDAEGQDHEVRARIVAGCDGSRSMCRHQFPEQMGQRYVRDYPYAWFGILCEAPPSAPELIYNHSERGFALISQRTQTLQRMYFQCDADTDPDDWSDDRIWDELQARVGANGVSLKEGPSPPGRCCRSARSSRSRCVTDSWCSPAMPVTRCHRPAPRDSTWRSPTPRHWRDTSRISCAAGTTTRSTTTRRPRSAGCGGRSTSPTG